MPWNEVMNKFKAGTLRSGGSGKKVTDPMQAVAIEYSEKGEAKKKPEYRAGKFAHASGSGK
jgi:Family of unknown function (DUF6496)